MCGCDGEVERIEPFLQERALQHDSESVIQVCYTNGSLKSGQRPSAVLKV